MARCTQEETTDDEPDFSMDGKDIAEGEVLDALVLDNMDAGVELDEAAIEAISAAAEYSTVYGDELLAEADAGGDDLSPAEGIVSRADLALDRILRSSSEAHEDAVAALAGSDVGDAGEVEDVQGPAGFRKYDEEVDSGLSEEQRAEVAQFKLTKTELANLVPEVRRDCRECGTGGGAIGRLREQTTERVTLRPRRGHRRCWYC